MTEPYSVLDLDEIEPIAVAGVHWKPLRRTLGIDAFGINAYTAVEAGEHVVENHTEEALGHQEVYVVVVRPRHLHPRRRRGRRAAGNRRLRA